MARERGEESYDGVSADKVLAWLYIIAAGFSLTLVICGSIAWGYWERTLNTCSDRSNLGVLSGFNCGCILSGQWNFNTFFGGPVSMCRYFTFAPLPVVIWSILMYIYHTCFPPRTSKPNVVDMRLRGRVLIRETPKRRSDNERSTITKKRHLYVPAVMAVASFVLVFSSSVVLSYGYGVTCRQYRHALVKQLQQIGDGAKLVLDRLTCPTIFDFMDYLLPDPPTLPSQYRRGEWKVNTGALLVLSLISDWFSVILYAFITIINISLCTRGKMLFFK